MRVFKILLASGVLAVFLIGAILFLVGYFKPKPAGVLIESTPTADVFIDGVRVGKTPYEATRKPGEVVVKLVPTGSSALVPFEAKIILASGIKTVITREFAETESASSGEIISFEKIGGSETSLAVVSIPDSAQISVDGNVWGFAPKISNIAPGEHQLVISANGYKDTTVSVKTVAGYKLTAIIKLAGGNLPVTTPTPTPSPKTLIEILPTPTGFLRVRGEPRISAPEVAQVKPGEKFPLVEEDQSSGWFKIEYLSGQTGWVSNQYAKKISGD